MQELPKAKEDTNKVNLLAALSAGYYSNNPDEGIKYGEMGLELAEKLNWKKGIGKIANSLGICNWSKSDYPKALDYYFKSLKIAEELNNKVGIASNLNNIGIIYEKQSNYPKALEYYFKALKINEELNNKNLIARALGNIGMIYSSQSNYPKALDYYFKALKIFEEFNDKRGISSSFGNIGSIYNSQSDYPKALEYYFKALKIFEEFNDKRGIAYNLASMGNLYIKLSQDTIFDKIHERNEFVGLTKEINLKKGIEYLLSSEKVCKEIKALDELIEVSNNLYVGYKLQGNYSKALEYHEQYKTMQDSVFNMDKAKSIANLEAKRENELKEKEILVQKAELSKKNWQLFGSATAVLLMLIFSFFVIRERRKSEKLLLNILPAKIARRLKQKEKYIADHFDDASVVFIDIVDFTQKSSGAKPERTVKVLNNIYTEFDKIAKKHNLEKIKTIGDCYMAAAGIPEINPKHAESAANFAIEAMQKMNGFDTGDGTIINFRCGIDCGPAVAGVIGEQKFIYDLWGDMVNTAARLEANGVSGKIQCSERFKEKLGKWDQGSGIGDTKVFQTQSPTPDLRPLTPNSQFRFEERGEIEVKGKGMMRTYFLSEN